jgi:hypothetical protein
MSALPRRNDSTLGWHSRGYLPHFDGGELAQFITFRLNDSLPRNLLIRWKEELKFEPSAQASSIMRRRVEAYLDQGMAAVTCAIIEWRRWCRMRSSFMIE